MADLRARQTSGSSVGSEQQLGQRPAAAPWSPSSSSPRSFDSPRFGSSQAVSDAARSPESASTQSFARTSHVRKSPANGLSRSQQQTTRRSAGPFEPETYLANFLQDVGAASLVPGPAQGKFSHSAARARRKSLSTSSSSAHGAQSPPPQPGIPSDEPTIARHVARVQEEIISLRLAARSRIQKAFPDFVAQYRTTLELQDRLVRLDAETDDLADQTDAFAPRLIQTLQRHAALQEEHLRAKTLARGLTRIVEARSTLASLKSTIDAGRLREAETSIQHASLLFRQAASDEHETVWIQQTMQWEENLSSYREMDALLTQSLVDAFHGAAHVEGAKKSGTASLTVREVVPGSQAPNAEPIALVDVLETLAKRTALEAHLTKLARRIIEGIVEPFLIRQPVGNSKSGAMPRLVQTGESTIDLSSGSATSRLAVLDDVAMLLAFLRQRFGIATDAFALFAAALMSLLLPLLIDKHLEAQLPSSFDGLVDYRALLDRARLFETELSSTGYLVSTEDRVLSRWADQAGVSWTRKIARQALEQVRRDVMSSDWEASMVDWTVIDPPVEAISTKPADDSPVPSTETVFPPVRQLSVEPADRSQTVTPSKATGRLGASRLTRNGVSPSAPRSLSRTPEPVPPPAPAQADQDEDDDAWDFDEAYLPDPPSLPPPSPMPSESAGSDGAWGFDDSGPASPAQSKASALSSARMLEQDTVVPQVANGTSQDDETGDAWGWDDDKELTLPSPASSRHSKRSANSHLVVQPSAAVPTSHQEKIAISTKSERLIELVKSVIREGQSTCRFSTAELGMSIDVASFVSSGLDLLDVFRATLPVHHARSIESVPSLGMQFANDCQWLAKEIDELRTAAKSWDITASVLADMQIVQESYERVHRDALTGQADLQKALIMSMLDETDHLRNTSDDEHNEACERALKQIVFTLKRLSQAWKPMMVQLVYQTLMGTLINDVLLRVLSDIENLADIAAEESSRLNALCKILHTFEEIYYNPANEQSTISLFVPVWFKFNFLSELLEASMVDIMFLHQEGHLVDFSKQELVALVRALFSESPTRQKNIEAILAAG
ncbi:uncharacterized protein L969DRAFT_47774 [Mixia osmundae IAM 14324]|uniref:ZW10 C-terminal helical domain-containing protein n=1 Tax=Mixia osmundae (strain CBS 9802 / IAM 14324 / JCM 22182 / KY 12970) TaxID=764103 RepID=G7E8M4_MIXOS|nr:uncharacterized protein L969DRAFT_47774 [Mixia osmundae IAM 14324]KEI40126.1 hypothetical protein L969DRAFT_47774 [Mixia osmundae IAM 14324]GAA99492.1 hypothetical protein E5Q_06192 [Mixia osmundae IAM 14324]